MRYRLMASYLGASYQAAIGPTDRDVTLFAAPPPPEEHGFSPVPGGIWRKYVRVDELDALWESRPIGSYHGEPCLVLDDLGDRLHIVYLGMDERRATQLGYWQVDKGVFEVVVARHEVTDLAEERHEFPVALLPSALPRALSAGGTTAVGAGAGAINGGQVNGRQVNGGQVPAWNGQPASDSYQMAAELPAAGPQQAPGGRRQLAAGLRQPSGGLAGVPRAVPGPQGRPPLPGPAQRQAPLSAGPGPATSQGYQPAPNQGYQFAGLPSAAQPQPQPQPQQPAAAQLLPPAQPPAAVVAWHGSPAADGNGTWFYQPADLDPQQSGPGHNGTVQNGSTHNGSVQNGAVHNGSTQNGSTPNGTIPNGVHGYGQSGQSLGYRQAPAAPPAPAQQYLPPVQPGLMQPVQPPQQLPPFPSGGATTFAPQPVAPSGPAAPTAPVMTAPPLPAPLMTAPGGSADLITTGPLAPASPADQADPAPQAVPAPPPPPAEHAERTERADQAEPAPTAGGLTAGGALSKLTGAVRGRRAARKPRLAMSAIFADLVDLAHIPRSAYAVDDEVTGAMCLFKTDGGYEVFSCAEDARHEVRFFEEEEAAYFYLFGVLAAEALRNGRLNPRRG